MNSLHKTVTRQRRGCDLNPGPSAPESSTLTTRLPSHALPLPSANIGGTHERDHGQVPGGGESRLGGARVLGADEGDGAGGVQPRHRPQRLERVGVVVLGAVLQPTGARRRRPISEQRGVGATESVVDRADKVLALTCAVLHTDDVNYTTDRSLQMVAR